MNNIPLEGEERKRNGNYTE